MLTIELKNLHFHAYHGLYKDEKQLGGDYEVNVSVLHKPLKLPILHIEETIDYTAIYALIREQMQQPRSLLEMLVISMAEEILTKFSQAEAVTISVKKLHPPIIAFEGAVAVSYVLHRNQFYSGTKS